MKEKKKDYKMILGMTVLVVILLLIAGGFWVTVSRQAAQEKQALQEEEANALTAIYVETGDLLRMQVFVDMNNETIFTAPIPSDGILDENGKSTADTSLNPGDIVKIYGNGIMTMSFPGQYNGVTKMQLTGHASEEELKKYTDLVESSLQGAQSEIQSPEE